MEKLYSVKEAAQALGGVSPWTIHAWISKGKLKKKKVGSRTMVSECAIEEFLVDCNAMREGAA